MPQKNIQQLRKFIDRIDLKILDLLNKRARISLEIGRLKSARGRKAYTPSRETLLVSRLKKRNRGPFPSHALLAVYREIISATRALQSPLTVAYLGPKGTFSHLAALKHFGHSAEFIPVGSIDRVFDEVEKKRAAYGVVPIENSKTGKIRITSDRLKKSSIKIVANVTVPVSHHLMSRSGQWTRVRKICSHPQAIAQSRIWIENNLPSLPLIEAKSTAGAAAQAAHDGRVAAIASEEAALIYHLKIVQRHIEDRANNSTRFLVIGPKPLRNR